jgi:hypothetical protein
MIEEAQTPEDIAQNGAATSWLESLPEEIRATPSLTKFKDTASLAQSYLEAEKALAGRVAIPKNDASEEEWSKFYSRLGAPEDKKYLDKRAPEDEEYLQAYEEMFYREGLSKRQGQRLLDSMYKFSTDLQKKKQEELQQVRDKNTEWLKSNYGDDFDGKMTMMQAALGKFGSKELAGLIEESSYDPAIVDLLVRVGETLKSDLLVTSGNQPQANSPEAALQEIKRLESDPEFMIKLGSKNHPGHDEAVQKMEDLYKIAYNKNK